MKQVPLLLAILPAIVSPARAQQTLSSAAFYLVPGGVLHKTTFGDDNPRSATAFGPALGARVRVGRVVVQGSYQFNAPQNPHFTATTSARAFCLEFGFQLGRQAYVRPSAGLLWHSDEGNAPLLGLAFGREIRVGRLLLSPELTVRGFWMPGYYGILAGVQVPVGTGI
jgi:hypothetical protein